MPRTCTICTHDQAPQINVALVSREAYRAIAGRYGVSKTALQRHSSEHIPQLLVKAYEALEQGNAEDLAHELCAIKSDVQRLKVKAEDQDDLRTALLACDKALKALELQAKVQQIIQSQPNNTVNIALVEHPHYKVLEDILTRALEPYPQARYAVADGLAEVLAELEEPG